MTHNPAPRPALARVRDIHCRHCGHPTPHLFRIDYVGQLGPGGGRTWTCRTCGTEYRPHLIPRDALRHDADNPKDVTP